MTKAHAQCSPSGADGWLVCAGWQGGSGKGSKFASEGTAAHEIASMALIDHKEPHDYIGLEILADGDTYTVDQAMADYVKVYTDTVRRLDAPTLVEQSLPVGLITGEEGATGTADAVVFTDDTLYIMDLKYGMGVEVSAYENNQLRIYALAALEEYKFMGDFDKVSLWIIQPRIDYITDWTVSVADLQAFRETVYEAAQRKLNPLPYWSKGKSALNPTEKGCRWCAKKATCPALAGFVMKQITDEFVDLDAEEDLVPKLDEAVEALRQKDAAYLAKFSDEVLSMMEMFIKGVRGRIESEIFAGRPVKGWKLVRGKQGNRAWTDKETVEAAMKSMKLKTDEMYDKTIISPTSAEKLLKNTKRWEKLQAYITRSEGKPSVAPESDKRPPLVLTPVEDAFQDETAQDLT